MTRVRVPGKEVCLAHVISPSQDCIYQNLGLHIGVHEGEDHTGESIGLIRFTPWGGSCSRCGYCNKERRCADQFYGSFLWFSDHHRQALSGTDCG